MHHEKYSPFARSLAFAHLLLVSALAFAVIEFAVFVPSAVGTATKRIGVTADRIDDLVSATKGHLNKTFEDTDSVILDAGLAMDHVRQAAADEQGYLKKLSGATLETAKLAQNSIRNLDGAISDTRQAISGVAAKTLPAVGNAIDGVARAAGSAGKAADGLTQMELEASALLGDAHVVLSDPAIQEITANVVLLQKEAEGIEVNVYRATGYVADDLAPNGANVWHRIWQVFFPGHTKSNR